MKTLRRSGLRVSGAAALFAGVLGFEQAAFAQQTSSFHLDRLEMPGSSQDGVAIFRPQVDSRPILFGQFAVGYSRRPLRTTSIISESAAPGSSGGVVDNQLTTYFTAGAHFLDRFMLSLSLPITPWQSGQNPKYNLLRSDSTIVDADGPAISDLRIDGRAVIVRSEDRRFAFGAGGHVFVPTGSSNFGGDRKAGGAVIASVEYALPAIILVANTGIHFRPDARINNPTNATPPVPGLGIGAEWRYGVGAFLPFKGGKYRLGASVFGSTGVQSNDTTGNTAFTKRNSPLEWMVEGRMRFGNADRMWLGVSAGTLILPGYGAPDFRGTANIGIEIPLRGADVDSDPKMKVREKWKKEKTTLDTDGDDIPDDQDACPTEAEDGKEPDPNDGCPHVESDRDGDGIIDSKDKCPDEPEDMDGIDDEDGCPETDADKDGVLDTEDACPKVPGSKSPDKAKNGCPQFISREGDQIRIFQQVHFATGSAKILPDSFPMLQEIANLLKSQTSIKLMAIEGHTDNRGNAAMNKTLSQNRADSVMKWLTEHAIAQNRLEAHGYGLEKPIKDNNTDAGRAENRRVEFKILKEE
jgi:OmpA-OmpF porin, OOP family